MPASQTREKGKDISVTRMETRTHFKTLIIERPERGKIHVSLPSLPKLSSVGYWQMVPPKVCGQRDLENTVYVIPPSGNHSVLCLKGPEKSYHKIVSAWSSNSQTFDHRNFILGFPLIKHLPEHEGTQCRGCHSQYPQFLSLTVSTESDLLSFIPLWPVFLHQTLTSQWGDPQRLWTCCYNTRLFTGESICSTSHRSLGSVPTASDKNRGTRRGRGACLI